jgi:hypothetical protein
MSTQKGNSNRNRPQKYKNTKAFKNDLHDTSHTTKLINSLEFYGLCKRCKEIIDWKVKYKKYKPLTTAKKWQVYFNFTTFVLIFNINVSLFLILVFDVIRKRLRQHITLFAKIVAHLLKYAQNALKIRRNWSKLRKKNAKR